MPKPATAALLTALLLAGCDTPIKSERAQFALKPGTSPDRIAQTYPHAIRAQTLRADGGFDDEIKGATCRLDSEEMTATVLTPARLDFPVMRGPISPMRVRCETKTLEGEVTLHPGKWGRTIIGPSVAGIATAIVSAGVRNTRDQYIYVNDPTWVIMTPKDGT